MIKNAVTHLYINLVRNLSY